MTMNTDLLLRRGVEDWLAGFAGETPVVVVPVFNAYEDLLQCLESLAALTPPNTPILILDDASTDPRIPDEVEPLARRRGWAYIRKPSNCGFVATVNLAFEWCAPHDVVIMNSDVIVPTEWLQRLRAAAYFRSTCATATPLTNHGTILSIPYRNLPSPELVSGMTGTEIDARIRKASPRLRPVIPAAVGHCIYFKRSALEVVGKFDEVFSPGYGEEVDFSQRAVMAGFCHVAADDLFVFHKGSASFDPKGRSEQKQVQLAHEKIIEARYPWYHPWVRSTQKDAYGPLAQALDRARAALLGYHIAIDATRVHRHTTGTQVLILELIRALALAPQRDSHLTMIIGDSTEREALMGVDELVDDVVRKSDLRSLDDPKFDLIHRPSQLNSAEDLALLLRASRRLVVSHLDSISFVKPDYAPSIEAWTHYRSLTYLTFALADGIAFISQDAAIDAAHQGLQVPSERSCVTYVGVDHQQCFGQAQPPAGNEAFAGSPFLLMLGTDFRHKNRPYAIRLLDALSTRYDWQGNLVFAGPRVSDGGSIADVDQELAKRSAIRSRVHDLGAVNEQEKQWLLENAALVLYPSVYEGFGLVPFEAAAAGTPALTIRSTSLLEVLGEKVSYLETLAPEDGADIAWPLISDPEKARTQVEAINDRALCYSWQRVAKSHRDFYGRILEMPPRARNVAEVWMAGSGARLGDPPVRSWPDRISRAFIILRQDGFRALWAEVKQFIEWRSA